MAQTIVFPNLMVGERRTLTVSTTLKSSGADKNPSGATALVYDHNVPVTGTVDSGSATSIVDAALAGADDKWNGLPITVTDITTGDSEQAEITDWDLGTTTLTITPVGFTIAAGDTYEIAGTPVLVQAVATVSGNDTSFVVAPADVTARVIPPAKVRLLTAVVKTTFSADDIQECIGIIRVVPSQLYDEGEA